VLEILVVKPRTHAVVLEAELRGQAQEVADPAARDAKLQTRTTGFSGAAHGVQHALGVGGDRHRALHCDEVRALFRQRRCCYGRIR
jgi:hypothetical protein